MSEGVRLALAMMLMGAVLVAVAAGCSTSSDEEQADRAPAIATTRPALAFAPLVHLYEKEPAKPIGAAEFVEHSSLTMANEPCPAQETVAIGATRLRMKRDQPAPVLHHDRLGGQRPYRLRTRAPNCDGHRGRPYATSEHTRPYDPGRPRGLAPHEGFYLDLLTSHLLGTADYRPDGDGQLEAKKAPIYYDSRPEPVDGRRGLRISYWLLFGLEGYADRKVAPALTHEGDWERIDVLLRPGGRPDRWAPVSVGYWIHGRRRDVPWDEVELASAGREPTPTHPVAYAARGNHAPYPDEGDTVVRRDAGDGRTVRATDERLSCRDCPRWRTWENLRPVRREPWYGYGGAWGAVGSSADNSSPIGPSPYSD